MHGRDASGGLFDGKGRVRAPWRPIVAAMDALGATEFAARATALDRRARTEQPRAGAGSPAFDPLPVPLSHDEFAALAAGLIERAGFLSLLLDDLYGARDTAILAALPPDARFRSPAFLRPLARGGPLAAPRMALYAADFARDGRGRFRVLRDHTDHVRGLGHALAIRRLTAEALPELFASVTLTSQRPAIEAFRDWLHRLAGPGPIGLLADHRIDDPGLRATDAADIALMARHLGATLLRPDDLACQAGEVRLRTLAGATTVKLMLRMMDSGAIDPLEQGGPPVHGVPGLFRSLRGGTLAMLNAPGSGLLQDDDIKAFIPACFERHHGRPPMLAQAVATDCQDVETNRVPMVRRYAEGESAGFDFAPLTLRLFALQAEGRWHVLPGGLGMVTAPDGSRLLKDVWVIDEGEPGPGRRDASPWQRPAPPAALRGAIDLPSRAADDLLWLGRMVERLDAASRLVAVAVPRFAVSSALPHEAAQRALLAQCLVRAHLLGDEVAGPFLSARILAETMGRRRPLAAILADIARLFGACAERFSVSMRAIIGSALDQVPSTVDDRMADIGACLRFVATFNGVVAEDAARGGGFLFLEIGRRLERAESLAETLAILLDAPPGRLDPGILLGIELVDAALTYEFTYSGSLAPAPALTLLIAARDYPRSLAFQTAALADAFGRLGAASEARDADRLTAAALSLVTAPAALASGLRTIADEVRALAGDFASRYFAPVPVARQTRQTR